MRNDSLQSIYRCVADFWILCLDSASERDRNGMDQEVRDVWKPEVVELQFP